MQFRSELPQTKGWFKDGLESHAAAFILGGERVNRGLTLTRARGRRWEVIGSPAPTLTMNQNQTKLVPRGAACSFYMPSQR